MKQIISFGFKYGGPNSNGACVLDVRRYFQRNPYRRKDLRELRGDDHRVVKDIESTPGFKESFDALLQKVQASKEDVIYLGCTGGHHRSVYCAIQIGKRLGYRISHRDYNRR